MGGLRCTMDRILASHSAAPGSIPGVSEFFQENIVNVDEVNQRRCCLEQWTAEG